MNPSQLHFHQILHPFAIAKMSITSHFSAVFEQYQKARTQFVQTVAELASRPQNIETLQNAGVMSLLRPLLLDIVPTIQQTAALALGRLANYNDDLAEAVVKGDILPQLVYSLAEQNVRRDICPALCLQTSPFLLCLQNGA